MPGPGQYGIISVDYSREEIKLLKIRITLQKSERQVGLAEAALRASCAEEVWPNYVLVLAGVGDA